MTAPLTKTFFRLNNVSFFPKTAAEASYIQRRLFDMGIFWRTGDQVSNLDECVAKGISVMKGRIYYGIDSAKWYIAREITDFKNANPADWQNLPPRNEKEGGLTSPQVLAAPKIAFDRATGSVKVSAPKNKSKPQEPVSLAQQLQALRDELAEVSANQKRIEGKIDQLLGTRASPAPKARRPK